MLKGDVNNNIILEIKSDYLSVIRCHLDYLSLMRGNQMTSRLTVVNQILSQCANAHSSTRPEKFG